MSKPQPSSSPASLTPSAGPAFARTTWYRDSSDARSPLAALLESVDFGAAPAPDAPALGQHLTIRLQGARGGTLVFRYRGVGRHTVPAYPCDQGVGEWRRDEFELSGAAIVHRITWSSAERGALHWIIEAQSVEFEAEAEGR